MASSDSRKYTLKARAERQRQTRDRIVAATEELHREVGPARTTVADIARRAGVQRLTVYTHFPEPAGLFAACQQRFLAGSPPPDLAPDPKAPGPADGLESALARLYSWFRATREMSAHVHRDRHLLPELDTVLRENADPMFEAAAGAHARALAGDGRGAAAVQPLVRLAMEFTTWRLLDGQGLDDRAMARLLREAAECAAGSGRQA